ncbi:fused response regulator/phosphatase [Chitiniphilus shinanonensis]|uniref:Fused response regulator/phosphatase n=1 Tax=Chitiniphilus shinanonensis TaxID=553088 RepID=A0ABQ6BT08_9NEIS|nr:fused response regulator/phosphatase [Chitiniphilus shinanonensis]GLS04926.1 fused response regulator/phosphatase [Chitiniphilus shinanonensis]
MKILVVDDTEAVLLLISRFVEALGHTAIVARDGGQAVEVWRAERPDMVLMDMMMPVMSGPEAAIAIKQEAGASWVPVVFVTGIGEENRLAEAIERGGDDYINKPVNFRVLEAKLKAFDRTLELNRKVREQSAKLADYYDRAEEEKRVVRHLMEQMVNAERLYDPLLEYWLTPAESLSGDLIAAARTPGQSLYVLLADGIGHGLTAALNVLPLTQPFYSMTEKGYSISDILTEMNNKVRQVLPVGRFVAVVLIAIDEANGWVDVWNGGMPGVQLIGLDGGSRHVWKSSHLPLGIVPTEAMDVIPERHYFDGPGSVVAYSDGLIEARNPLGEPFGAARLMDALVKAPPAERMAEVKRLLTLHLDGAPHHDDISLIMAHCGLPQRVFPDVLPAGGTPDFAALFEPGEPSWRYSLTLGAHELRHINTVPFMMNFINKVVAPNESQSDVFLILTELFVNALDHGVLGMDSALKREPEGIEFYLNERAKRLAALAHGMLELDLAGLRIDHQDYLRIIVKDSGDGFDWRHWLAQDLAYAGGLSGRGIALVRALCASLQYRGAGNEVHAYYRIKGARPD